MAYEIQPFDEYDPTDYASEIEAENAWLRAAEYDAELQAETDAEAAAEWTRVDDDFAAAYDR